jgi:hypothetical protein
MTTPILSIGELAQSQASKYVTVNEALRRIESVMISVLSQTNAGPPGSPADGDAYIVDSASGTWSAFAVDDVVYYSNGSWYGVTPFEGWTLFVVLDTGLYVYISAAWTLLVAVP